MLKDPASKGCNVIYFEIPDDKRWIGLRYTERNKSPASRYFTKFEPIIVSK